VGIKCVGVVPGVSDTFAISRSMNGPGLVVDDLPNKKFPLTSVFAAAVAPGDSGVILSIDRRPPGLSSFLGKSSGESEAAVGGLSVRSSCTSTCVASSQEVSLNARAVRLWPS